MDQDDVVVQELDVYLCNGILGATQVYLMQYPLRPPWRPYGVDQADHVKIKPEARKVELQVPIEHGPRLANYDDEADESIQLQDLTLASTQVDLKASFAAGVVQDGKLFLTPINEAVSLRPQLKHLDKAPEAKPLVKAEGAGSEAPMPIAVQVKRKETEKQQENRLRSYGYLKEVEEKEAWRELKLHSAASTAAHNLRAKLLHPQDRCLPMDLPPDAYLASLVPGIAMAEDDVLVPSPDKLVKLEEGSAPGMKPAPGGLDGTSTKPNMGIIKTEGNASAASLPPSTAKAIPDVLMALFKHNPVASMTTIRIWLQRAETDVLKNASKAPEEALHAAIVQSPAFTCIRGKYLRALLGDRAVDGFRNLVLSILREKESFKRAEVMEAARSAGLTVPDSLYSRVVKDLCCSKGSAWSLKQA